MYTKLTVNLSGRVRREQLNGRDHLVAPLVLIVPGVLAGSKGPLYYPPAEVKRSASAWNGVPITLEHPYRNGKAVSAHARGVLDRQGIGVVRNAQCEDRLMAEGWFDLERTRRLAPGVLDDILARRPIELSTGLFTENERSRGVFNGRSYTHIARNYRPDHLAILADSRGACSVDDGCGVGIANASMEDQVAELRARGLTKEQSIRELEPRYPTIRSVIDRLWRVASSTAIGAVKGAGVGAALGASAGSVVGAGVGFIHGLLNEESENQYLENLEMDDDMLMIPTINWGDRQPRQRPVVNYVVDGDEDALGPMPSLEALQANKGRGCRGGCDCRSERAPMRDELDDDDMLLPPGASY